MEDMETTAQYLGQILEELKAIHEVLESRLPPSAEQRSQSVKETAESAKGHAEGWLQEARGRIKQG